MPLKRSVDQTTDNYAKAAGRYARDDGDDIEILIKSLEPDYQFLLDIHDTSPVRVWMMQARFARACLVVPVLLGAFVAVWSHGRLLS
jgi:hypothetical protein